MDKKASNLYEFVEDEGVVRWLSLCGFNTEKMSDFEKLSAYMDSISPVPHKALKKNFFEKVSAVLEESVDPNITAHDIWKKWNRKMMESWGLVVEDCSSSCGKKMYFPAKIASVVEKPTKRTFDLNQYVDSLGEKDIQKDFAESTNELLLDLKQEKAPYCLALNIENIDFCRGDHYHAGLAYEKLVKKLTLSEGELECYILWLLSYVLEKHSGNCVLYLDTGLNITSAKALISYLEMRGFLPRIYLAVTKENREKIKELCDLCLFGRCGKITLDLVLEAETSSSVIKSRLTELLSEYPIQSLGFSGDDKALKIVEDILNE